MNDGKRKPLNLLEAIHTLEKQRNQEIHEHEERLRNIDAAITAVRKANEVCWFCGGAGYKLRERVCAEDDRPDPNDPRDRIKCKACHGTGWKHWKDEKGVEHSAEIDYELLR